MEQTVWRHCVACKKPIFLGQIYYVCSVSSCSRVSAPVQFCSFDCWAVHNEIYNHRNAAAVEETAPRETDTTQHAAAGPAKHQPDRKQTGPSAETLSTEGETLVVVSKVKKYIQEKSGMNTSADTMDALSDTLRRQLDQAIANAKKSGRKTVMARDLPHTR